MNKSWMISRRTVLKGLGAAVALPALDVMAPAQTHSSVGTVSARRIAYIYFPNGIPEGIWKPNKVASDGSLLRLNEWMSPLEHFTIACMGTRSGRTSQPHLAWSHFCEPHQ